MRFIGRRRELQALRQELARPRPSLIIIYGRRRVGKSRLILEAVRGTPHVYFQAVRLTEALNIEQFKAAVARYVGQHDPVLASLRDWDGILTYLRRLPVPGTHPLTIVLDEFPYLCESGSPGLPSILQRVWDEIQREQHPVNIILCGSSVAFMEGLLAERNPLYGRQTRKFRIEPLGLRDVARYFSGWPAEDIVRAYGIFGGIPYYFTQCSPDRSLRENICDVVLADGSPLREEPEHVLQAELRSVERYAAVVQAVAFGATKLNEIVGRIPDLRSGPDVSYYLKRLQDLHIIRRDASLDRPDRAKERNARYYLEDAFMAFWYRFVLPNISALQAGFVTEVYEKAIAPHLDEYLGEAFERICREHVLHHGNEVLGEPAREAGKIWGDDFDIDVAGLTLQQEAFFGECKWSRHPVEPRVLAKLRENIRKTSYGRGRQGHYELLFSRSGFDPELRRQAQADQRLKLITLEMMVQDQGQA